MDYSRQEMVIGKDGQRKLAGKRALLVGVGAIGTLTAEYVVRAGIGLRIADPDKIEESNLQRQVLFDSGDVGKPKAEVAAAKLRKMNPDAWVEGVREEFSAASALRLCKGIDIILDGTDSMATRFIMNDAAVKTGIPYVYAACAGTVTAVSFLKGRPCLNCFMPHAEGMSARNVGVLGPAAGLAASVQSYIAISYLSGSPVATGVLRTCSLKNDSTLSAVKRRASCETCGKRKFPYLEVSEK